MLRKPLGIALYLNSIPPYFRRLLSLSQAGKTISMESGIKRNEENRQRNFCVGKCRRVKKRFRQCQFQTPDDLFQIRRMQNLETDKRAFETLSFRKNIWHLAPKALFTLLILVFLLTKQYILHSLHSLPATCLYFYISHLEENTWPPAAVYIVFDTASLSIKKNSHLKTRGQETDRQTRSGNGTSQTRTGQTQKSIHFELGK